MAFNREANVTKDSIQDFQITFFVPGPDNLTGAQSGQIEVQIKLSDGSFVTKAFDLLARLNDDAPGLIHQANLVSLRNYIRTRLDSEVLP